MTQGKSVPKISVSGIVERDVDLILLEEFVSSVAFVNWFLESVGFCTDEPLVVGRAERSVTQSIGESDLEIVLVGPNRNRYILLIENKINASFQPLQAERYRQRGQIYLEQETYYSFRTVLVAPATYLGTATGNKGFDAILSYEKIMEWFESNKTLGNRSNYKIALLSSAIEKATLGYQPEEDFAVNSFWREYWELSLSIAPELEMREPTGKPAGAGFIYFHPFDFPKGVDIVHKTIQGNLDLQFKGFGRRLSELWNRFYSYLEEDMAIDRASGSGAIRIKVPVIDPADSFKGQRENAVTGLKAAKRLFQWYLELDPELKAFG